jgi:hypothetical protein
LSGDEAQVLRARIAAGRQTLVGEVVKTGSASLSALPRREPALQFDELWIERGFELFATVAGGNCAHVQRLLAAEIGDEGAVPTRQTVYNWSVQFGWRERRDLVIVETKGRTKYELALLWRAIVLGGGEQILAAQTGAFDDNPAAGLVRLKATEIGMRQLERGVISLEAEPPEEKVDDEEDLSRAEKEARAGERMAQRKQGRG